MQKDKNINSYSCSSCGKNFKYHSSQIRHMRKHTGERPHQCTLCGKTFMCKSGLDSHVTTHTGIKPHQCTFCDKTFRRTGDLNAHIRIHTGEKKYKCDICGKAFIHHSTLKNHVLSHLDLRPYACSQCGKKFRSLGHVKVHERNHTGERPYHCDACDATFTRNSHLTCHKKSSCKGKFVSNDKSRGKNAETPMVDAETILSKNNDDSSNIQTLVSNEKKSANISTVPIANENKPLKEISQSALTSKPNCGNSDKRIQMDGSTVEKMSHQKINVDKKTFSCATCKIIYKSNGNYIRHMRKHTGERPYQCTLCRKTFICKKGLDCHTMTHTGSRPHRCSFCGKTFRQTGAMYEHIRIHTGEKRYQCDMCGKAFTHNATLKNHVLCHLDSRPYACKQCGQKFRSSGHLNVHKRKHTGERPYQCDACGTAFTTSSHLNRHQKNCKGNFNRSKKRTSKKKEKSSVIDAKTSILTSENSSTIYTSDLSGCEVSTEVIVCTEQIEMPVNKDTVYALSPFRNTTINNRIEISTGDTRQFCVLGDLPMLVQTQTSKDEFGLTVEVCSHLEKSDTEDNVDNTCRSSSCDLESLATDHRANSQSEALLNCIPHGMHSSFTDTNKEAHENCVKEARFVSDHTANSQSETLSNSILHIVNYDPSELSENCDNLSARLKSPGSNAVALKKVSEHIDENSSRVIIQDLECINYLYMGSPLQIVDNKGISKTLVILEDITESNSLLLSDFEGEIVCDSLVKESQTTIACDEMSEVSEENDAKSKILIMQDSKKKLSNEKKLAYMTTEKQEQISNKNLPLKTITQSAVSLSLAGVARQTHTSKPNCRKSDTRIELGGSIVEKINKEKCDVDATCNENLAEKINVSKNPLACDSCKIVFEYNSHYSRHMQKHTGQRPYQCTICGKTFKCGRGLDFHTMTHNGTRPHRCDFCGKTFRQTGALYEHIRIHTGEKKYQCDMCGKAFTHNATLKNHILCHLDSRPYVCKQCGQKFRSSGHLNVHKRKHTGERPYQCDDCGAAFSASSHLTRHKKICKGKICSNDKSGKPTSKRNEKDSDIKTIISPSENLSNIYTDGLPGCEVSTEVIVCTEQKEIPVNKDNEYTLSPHQSTINNCIEEIETSDSSQLCVLEDFPMLVQTEN